ncbi:MAG: hypothetical protein [Cotesia congregata filamentous virus 2]
MSLLKNFSSETSSSKLIKLDEKNNDNVVIDDDTDNTGALSQDLFTDSFLPIPANNEIEEIQQRLIAEEEEKKEEGYQGIITANNTTTKNNASGIQAFLQSINPTASLVPYGYQLLYHSTLGEAAKVLGLYYNPRGDPNFIHINKKLWGLSESKIQIKSCLLDGIKLYNHGAWSLMFIDVLTLYLRNNNRFFSFQNVIAMRDVSILYEDPEKDNIIRSKVVTPNKEFLPIDTITCVSLSGHFIKKQVYYQNKYFNAISFHTPYSDDESMTVVQNKISNTTLIQQKISNFNVRDSYVTLIVKQDDQYLISTKFIQLSTIIDEELPIMAFIYKIVDAKRGKNPDVPKPKFTEYINVRLKPVIVMIDYKYIAQIKSDLFSFTRNDWSDSKNIGI